MARKQFQDLNLKDAFLFAAALSDEETCRMLLEIILEEEISDVKVHTEHSILYNSDFRSIRLDVYASKAEGAVYNVEMQGENKGNLPRRSRYHQAELDVMSLKPGDNFAVLKDCYIIFICAFDPFGQGLYRYTFENRCTESGLILGDGAKRIFLSTKGNNDEQIPAALKHFLHYVETSTAECAEETGDSRVKTLHHKVTALKASREWEKRYMTVEELINDAKKEEQSRFGALIRRMSESGEQDKLALLSDEAFLQEMYLKYQL